MHEVGHTLGLRHNFRSSRVYSDASSCPTRSSRARTRITGSVMEYAPSQPRRGHGPRACCWHAVQQLTLGPYDYWAIEYAYKPLATRPAEAGRAARRSPSRSAEPQLAYGTDEDNFLGIDPESLQFDLGNDVVGVRDEAHRDRARPAQAPGDARARARPGLHRAAPLGRAMRSATSASAAGVLGAPDRRRAHAARLARQRPRSAAAGAGRATSARRSTSSRAACSSADSFRVSPALQRKLAHRLPGARRRAVRAARPRPPTDFSLAQQVLGAAARVARPADERHRRRRACSDSESEGAGTGRCAAACPSCTAASTARSGASSAQRRHRPAAPRAAARARQPASPAMLLRPGASSRADARSLRAHPGAGAARADPDRARTRRRPGRRSARASAGQRRHA